MTMACHCPGCQRMAASAFSLTAMFASDAFDVVSGDVVIGGLHGADLQHHFCAYCMTWMFTRISDFPWLVNVRPTMFDDHGWFAPFGETFTRMKLPWATTGAPRAFEEFPPMDQWDTLMREYRAWMDAERKA